MNESIAASSRSSKHLSSWQSVHARQSGTLMTLKSRKKMIEVYYIELLYWKKQNEVLNRTLHFTLRSCLKQGVSVLQIAAFDLIQIWGYYTFKTCSLSWLINLKEKYMAIIFLIQLKSKCNQLKGSSKKERIRYVSSNNMSDKIINLKQYVFNGWFGWRTQIIDIFSINQEPIFIFFSFYHFNNSSNLFTRHVIKKSRKHSSNPLILVELVIILWVSICRAVI